MARKVTRGQALVGLAVTLVVVYLNTIVVWLWPDTAPWAIVVVLSLSVLAVVCAYRIERKQESSVSDRKE
jgi:membrane protein implicated in regulation of membrane protease activity